MLKKYIKISLTAGLVILGGCNLRYISFNDLINGNNEIVSHQTANTPLREASSVVVCRSKQCAPAKISMSSQYIYNSLLHLFENNNHQKMLVCQANPSSKTCLENYITLPITVGITPAYMYIDSVKITDVIVNKGNNTLSLILNYNVTYNGQTPDCTPAQSILYVRNVNHILLEDPGYNCKMTTLGTTNIKTVFIIDYVDLDYGFIGGYYSLGLSGPAYGGGTGYMLLRLPKDAYPLSPALKAQPQKRNTASSAAAAYAGTEMQIDIQDESGNVTETEDVQVFPYPQNTNK